jgi:hypothetical protein
MRTLSVFLIVWFAAASSLPTCCWSIVTGSAAESAAPAASPHDSQAHHAPDPHAGHAGHQQATSDEATFVAKTIGNLANDCAPERNVAITLSGTSLSFKLLFHTAAEAPLPWAPLAVFARSSLSFDDISPGTVSTASLFQSPLRI